jgi:uncharacterized protein YrrD
MLIKGSDVIGTKIITINEGKEIEDVDDIVYDPTDNRVKALLVAPGGLFSDAKVILTEDVTAIGEDAVLVESRDVLKDAGEVKGPVSSIAEGNTYLTKNKVISEEGKDLGTITDIYFDNKTGLVSEFEVSQGLEDIKSGRKRIKITDIITVGEDAVIVRGYVEEEIQKQSEKGGVVGAVSKVKEEAPKMAEQARQKAQELTQKTREKAEEIRQRPQTQEAIERAKMETEKARQKAEEVITKETGRKMTKKSETTAERTKESKSRK